MEQDLAKKLFEEGATLFLFKAPKNMEFGIDLSSWNITDKFVGVKMIPNGVHFVYYSAISSEGSIAPRTGFFHNFRRREILAKTWCTKEEDFIDSNNEEGTEYLQARLRDYDRNLAAYPYELWKKWVSLSNKLDDEVVQRIQPVKKNISSVPSMISPPDASRKQPEFPMKRMIRANLEESLLPQLIPCPDSEIRFTNIPECSFPVGSTASQITKYSLDTSYILEQMLSAWGNRHEKLLAELQFAFLSFLAGQVYTAFEQWKSLVNMICCADEYLLKNPALFKEFTGDLYFQMQEVPTDFFVDTISRENFLTHTLRILFGNVKENNDIDQDLKRKCEQLHVYLRKRFNWDFECEPDDDAPVVVENVENE